MPNDALTAAEEAIMKETFKATMRRAADIIDRITTSDVLRAQRVLLRDGVPLVDVCRLDRASLASAHLRACAEGDYEGEKLGLFGLGII